MSKNRRAVLLVVLVFLITIFFYWQYFEKQKYNFKVVFFDVGQGDAAFINFSNGKKALVDCGPNAMILSKLGNQLPFYDRKIDYLIITHPDLDHYGGCLDVLENYQVENIIENGDEKKGDPYWREWDRLVKEEKARRLILTKEIRFDFGNEKIKFFFPNPSFSNLEGNSRSLVFKLVTLQSSFLFMGDAEYILEEALLQKYEGADFKSDYLKIGHHGSDSSTSDELLEAVRPKVAVVSVGKNKFGHPSLRVLRKLERANADVWRTDVRYDIIIKED